MKLQNKYFRSKLLNKNHQSFNMKQSTRDIMNFHFHGPRKKFGESKDPYIEILFKKSDIEICQTPLCIIKRTFRTSHK
jgi:hypothetical protein